MKQYPELTDDERAGAYENQFQVGANLLAQGDLGGLADFLGIEPGHEAIGAVAESIRIAKLDEKDPAAVVTPIYRNLIGNAAQARAERAYYREPGDLVVGLHDQERVRQPGSTGRVKIRVLGAHEGGSDSDVPQEKIYGVFVDDQFAVATVRCVARTPELWAGFDLEGNRITPASLFKPKAIRRQKAAVRGWLLSHFNERAERGEFDDVMGR